MQAPTNCYSYLSASPANFFSGYSLNRRFAEREG